MNTHRMLSNERGAILIMVLAVMSFLTFLATSMWLQSDASLLGSQHESLSTMALQAAEAGVQFGLDQLEFEYDYDPANPHAVIGSLSLFAGDSWCHASGGCSIVGWYALHDDMQTFTNDTQYRVVVKPDGTARLLLRCYAILVRDGTVLAKRMIEVEVEPEPSF